MTMESESKEIGQRIREERIKRKMSQADLAVAALVSLPHINQIELGKAQMRVSTFKRIVNALHVPADLLLGTEAPEAKNHYIQAYGDLLKNCSTTEAEHIVKVVEEVKRAITDAKGTQE